MNNIRNITTDKLKTKQDRVKKKKVVTNTQR